MKKEDYLGKWILRQGDLLPEQIDNFLWKHYCFTINFCEYLTNIGLIFDDKVQAIKHYRCIMGSVKKPVDEIKLRDKDYEDIKKQAIDDLINSPQETFLKVIERERKYKEAFNRVLKREGFVTGESLAKEMEEPYTLTADSKSRIYISGPISGNNLDERHKAFKEIQEHLEAQGYEVVNPMENGLPAEATTHEHMKRDIELLMTCDYIYMMRRWTHSKGCKVEFDVATAIGLPVFFEESGEITKFE